MKTVGFYINGFSPRKGFTCDSLLKGNPGLGGTEYMVLLICYLLQLRDNGILTVLYTTGNTQIDGIENVEKVSDFREAQLLCSDRKTDYLVFCHDSQLIDNLDIMSEPFFTRLIVWCHNFVTWKELDFYSSNPAIWRVINVGKEQQDLYLDHGVISKSEYIYNCVPRITDSVYDLNEDRGHIVTYMGCIWPRKGFHWLAESWPEVVKAVPDAELYVIGSGKLYGWDGVTGKYGLADATYENSFMHFLECDGRLMPSVHLMGVLGEEKNDILRMTKVGVPNPTGNTETFCITAVEMQSMGAQVVMGKCPGALETVIDGYLISNRKQLSEAIIAALSSNRNNYDETINQINEKFSQETVVRCWEELLISGAVSDRYAMRHLMYRFKWLKKLMALVRKVFPRFCGDFTIERVLLILERRLFKGRAMYQYIP